MNKDLWELTPWSLETGKLPYVHEAYADEGRSAELNCNQAYALSREIVRLRAELVKRAGAKTQSDDLIDHIQGEIFDRQEAEIARLRSALTELFYWTVENNVIGGINTQSRNAAVAKAREVLDTKQP